MSTPGIIVNGDGVEVFLRGTAGDDAFSGSWLSEAFYTGAGNDWVYAAGGDDVVISDFGNDTLDGAGGSDTLTFAVVNTDNAGNSDLAPIGVTFDLAKHVQTLEYYGTKTTYGFENLIGTYFKDVLFGDSGTNLLDGNYGDDVLSGRGGNDTIKGNFGRDTIIGGAGQDSLYGKEIGLGDTDRDVFRYKAMSDSGIGINARDSIYGDFNGGAATGDVIDLKALDANGSAAGNGTFHFIGTKSFHHNSDGEVQVRATANANEYLVRIDMDNDAGAEMAIIVHSSTALTAADFIL